MVKECLVKLNNEAVTVIDYEGTQVQIPSIHRKAISVKVIYEKGKYIVVDDDYIEPVKNIIEKPYRKVNKKTTIDKNAEEIDNSLEKSEIISE